MPSLAEHQRAMLGLVKGRGMSGLDDPYLARVAGSTQLALMREISAWWCALGIRGACPWTSRLLDRLGLFDACVEAFCLEQDVSPYIEKAGRQFLSRLRGSGDCLVASLAGFELALLAMRRGEDEEFTVEWDRNPDSVMTALGSGADLPPAEAGCLYRLRLSLPDLMSCERLELAPSSA